MDPREFYQNVHEHEDLEWVGVSGEEVIVKNKQTAHRFAFEPPAIRENPWSELLDVLLGKRLPNVMGHYSRIVGYYANLRNWNRSKIAELNDRHKGNYVLPERVHVKAREAQKELAQTGQPVGV